MYPVRLPLARRLHSSRYGLVIKPTTWRADLNGHARALISIVMITVGQLTRNGLVAATLLASPLLSQTDSGRPADFSTTSRADDHREDAFDMGWLGLIGLAGLAGLRRKSSVPVTHPDGDGSGARVYPSKA